jgi:hypothetical protein
MVNTKLVSFGFAVGGGYLYFKSSIDKNWKKALMTSKKFVKQNRKLSMAGSVVVLAVLYKVLARYREKAWSYMNFGMELTSLARQLERTAAESDSDNMSRHCLQWTEYALKTALQMNKQCRTKLEEHYNISGIRAQLKTKMSKDEKLEAWNRVKVATFSILFISHFQTVFVWLKSRLIFSICFRRDYQRTKQDQMLTGPSARSTGNNDQQSFVASLTYLPGDKLLQEVVESVVRDIIGERGLAEQLSLENYIKLLEEFYTSINKQIFESHKEPKEFFISTLLERDDPVISELAEMEGELHMILDNPDCKTVLQQAFKLSLEKIIAQARELFAASKKKKENKIFLVHLIAETRTLTKTMLPILPDEEESDTDLVDPLSLALESENFDDFFNIISNIK